MPLLRKLLRAATVMHWDVVFPFFTAMKTLSHQGHQGHDARLSLWRDNFRVDVGFSLSYEADEDEAYFSGSSSGVDNLNGEPACFGLSKFSFFFFISIILLSSRSAATLKC